MPHAMRLALGGGGGAEQLRPLDEQLAAWMGANARLLYLPFALPDDHPLLPGCEHWIASVFEPLGVAPIETWHPNDILGLVPRKPLRSFDGIYIGAETPSGYWICFGDQRSLKSLSTSRCLADQCQAAVPVPSFSATIYGSPWTSVTSMT